MSLLMSRNKLSLNLGSYGWVMCRLGGKMILPPTAPMLPQTEAWKIHQCESYKTMVKTIDVTSQYREDWQLATVVNSTLVVELTMQIHGFDLQWRQWLLLNRFWTGQGHCNACHKKWGFTNNELCDCGEIQTMSQIVNSCPLTKFDGGLLRLHEQMRLLSTGWQHMALSTR